MNKHNTIYQFWTGTNEITPNRLNCLSITKENVNVNFVLITPQNIGDYILKDFPLHPGYEYLSYVHKSDYLRSYFMYHHGGGYADIKAFGKNNNFNKCFTIIKNNKEIDIIGQQEIPNGSSIKEFNTPEILNNIIISNCWFICRDHSFFTKLWYDRVQKHMDQVYEKIKKFDVRKQNTIGGLVKGGCGYPLTWTEIQGDIFHQVCYDVYQQCPNKISNILKPDRLTNIQYR